MRTFALVVVVIAASSCADTRPSVLPTRHAQADPSMGGESETAASDLCPNDEEDLDGFEDEDGCPDLDNDGDRIADADDSCPHDPETYNGVSDEDGCPEGCRLPIAETPPMEGRVQFASDAADLTRGHAAIVALAEALRVDPAISELAVVGYASADEVKGTRLAHERARAVYAALIARGVAASRLRVFYAVDSTRVDSTTPESRELSRASKRRVEFHVMRTDSLTVARWDGTHIVDADD